MDAQYWIPTVKHQDQYMDIYSSMLAKGIIFVNAKIDQRIAGLITTCLLHINETADIVQPKLYLNTSQGDIVSAMSVVDVMQFLKDNKKHRVNIEKIREKVIELFAEFSGQDPILIMAHLNKQDYLDANEAKGKGLVDGII